MMNGHSASDFGAASKRASNGLAKRPRSEMPAPDARPSNMRSFSDMLGRSSSRAEQALGGSAPDDAWAAITSTVDNIAPTAVRPVQNLEESPNLEDEGNGFFSNAHVDTDQILQGPDATALPSDFSLKNSVDIVSSRSLQWVLRRAQVPEYAAVHQVSCGDTSIPDDIRELLSEIGESNDVGEDVDGLPPDEVLQEFSAALLHYRHPHEELPGVISKKWQDLVIDKLAYRTRTSESRSGEMEMSKVVGSDHQSLALDRVEMWQEAFRSLFYGYRHGYVDHFYVILSTTVAFFGRKRISESGEDTSCTPSAYHRYLGAHGSLLQNGTYSPDPEQVQSSSKLSAFFSRATAGLREMLSSFGVHYETKDGLTKDPDPCLIVDGEREAQALFNFISAIGPRLSNATDVPILICDWSFRWATLVSAIPVNARETRTSVDPKTEGGLRHSIEVCGYFTPLQIARMYVALRCSQKCDFTLFMGTEPKSNRLNVCVEEQRGNEKPDAASKMLGPNVVSRLDSTQGGKLAVYIRSAD